MEEHERFFFDTLCPGRQEWDAEKADLFKVGRWDGSYYLITMTTALTLWQ